jgi:hypothetical protein
MRYPLNHGRAFGPIDLKAGEDAGGPRGRETQAVRGASLRHRNGRPFRTEGFIEAHHLCPVRTAIRSPDFNPGRGGEPI